MVVGDKEIHRFKFEISSTRLDTLKRWPTAIDLIFLFLRACFTILYIGSWLHYFLFNDRWVMVSSGMCRRHSLVCKLHFCWFCLPFYFYFVVAFCFIWDKFKEGYIPFIICYWFKVMNGRECCLANFTTNRECIIL